MTLDVIQAKGQHRIGFEAFGVPISVEVGSEELLTRVRAILPPGWRLCDRVPKEHRFTLRRRGGATYRLEHPGESLAGGSDVDVALEVLDAELRAFTAMNAPEHIFVHAGVVALGDLAIVMPGPTFSGKTTLVTELIRAGALYYSDDLAAFDRDGLVHAYPKPLSIRTNGLIQTNVDIAAFGGTSATAAIPIGAVIFSQYRPGARWDPRPLSSGDAMLALLSNTVPAHDRTDEALTTLSRAIGSAYLLDGERGEASEVVEQLLQTFGVPPGNGAAAGGIRDGSERPRRGPKADFR